MARTDGYRVMLKSKFARLAHRSAAKTMVLRAAVVGINFAVMLGLAAILGFETFGRLAALWATALVAGTVVSLGGPLILLAALTDGQGLRVGDIVKIAVFFPALLALFMYGIAVALWPAWPWAAILSVGVLANALGCLASVMRALGSAQASMALRDAGPQLALGFAGVIMGDAGAEAILISTAATMGVLALGGVIWVCRHAGARGMISPVARRYISVSLWGTSVMGMVVAQIDLVLGGAVISAEQLGVYAVLRRVANLVALPVTVATWVSGPSVSAAHGAGDMAGLARASARGSQIALVPGLVLFVVGIAGLPLLPEGQAMVFALLLLGALGQIVLAASFTVATLCGLPHFAMSARVLMVACYLLWFQWWGAELTTTTNALGYIGALTLGGIALWWGIRRKLEIDTSAAAVLHAKGGQWKTS